MQNEITLTDDECIEIKERLERTCRQEQAKEYEDGWNFGVQWTKKAAENSEIEMLYDHNRSVVTLDDENSPTLLTWINDHFDTELSEHSLDLDAPFGQGLSDGAAATYRAALSPKQESAA